MAIEWSKKVCDCTYEVRSAGNTLRLYTNNVFHSQYNAKKPLQGGIWDLLSLPAFHFNHGELQRILVLGVGGGTVLKQLQRYLMPHAIVGVEINPVHLKVASQYFGVKHRSIELIEADAIDWLSHYDGEKFDLIIDDLFGHNNNVAERVVNVNKQWTKHLLRNLNSKGMLVINFGDNKELNHCAMVSYKKLKQTFKSIVRLTLPAYENAIGVFSYKTIDTKKMRENCQQKLGLTTKLKKQQLTYNIKKIK